MVHKKEEGTYHCIEKLMKEMPGFLSLSLLLIPEYSEIKRRGKPLPGLRNAGISFFSFPNGDKYPLPSCEPYGKSDYLQLSLSLIWIAYVLKVWNFNLYLC